MTLGPVVATGGLLFQHTIHAHSKLASSCPATDYSPPCWQSDLPCVLERQNQQFGVDVCVCGPRHYSCCGDLNLEVSLQGPCLANGDPKQSSICQHSIQCLPIIYRHSALPSAQLLAAKRATGVVVFREIKKQRKQWQPESMVWWLLGICLRKYKRNL